jgi:hypothetical protein
MATVKTQDGKVVLKDGRVSCECCGPPCPDSTCSGFAVANISEAQAAAIYEGGYWTFTFNWTRNARLEGYFQEFANDPLIIYIAYNTNFDVSHTETVFRSGCNFGYSIANIGSFGRNIDYYDGDGNLDSSTTGGFSGNNSGSLTVNLRKRSSGGGYCVILSAVMSTTDTIHPKNTMTLGTILGSSSAVGNSECGTLASIVLNPVIVSANGTHNVTATFSAGPP